MAHFAKIGLNSKVIAVHAVNNSDCLNADGVEDETIGQQFLERLHSWPASMWIQTSYNTKAGKHSSGDDSKALRGSYAGIGDIWDEDNNIFYGKKPHASWVLNITTGYWHSPIGDAPTFTNEQDSQNTANTHHWLYVWNEDGKSWDLTDTLV